MARKPSRKTLSTTADKLFSRIVRARGYCEASKWGDGVECGGGLQCAHIVGRANRRLRWVFDNALSLCAGHHVWYTNHPLEWFEQVQLYLGEERWKRLRAMALEVWDRDLEGTVARLKEEANALGIG